MSDEQARREAVDPARSVIVQAPAGSGKTTLLVERYLGLLAVAEAPEEILAITFTRKAAAEMKQRILRYLDPAFTTDEPHEQATLAKARAVQDKAAAWGLRENPQRLLIRTIDSFNHYLARTMPVASQLGPVPAPADNTQALYRQAARRVLALVDDNDPTAPDLERLLDWRDHRSQDIEDLLAGLLAKRDQWLRALGISGPPQRQTLEAVLEQVVTGRLDNAAHALHAALDAGGCDPRVLTALLQFAAANLEASGRPSAVCMFAEEEDLPPPSVAALPLWRGLGEALLTGKDELRKPGGINARNGFPPKTTEKEHFQALLESLAGQDELARTLAQARRLPEPRYDDEEWAVLEALVRVLHRAAGELELVFAAAGQTDFTGLAAAALRGLGDEDSGYTDLGLYLDRRIRHILVDEFQDTNQAQLRLLETLTAGWEGESPDCRSGLQAAPPSRTLFLVGDPMQSIYRFREADVGLFIRSRDHGVGPVTLEPKRLATNFRSRAEIVEWVNGRLGPIFPATEDISAGAVSYAPSDAGRGPGGAVELTAHAGDAAEGDAIASLLAEALAEHADDADFKGAIIVRARSHLREILPALDRHGVAFRAVKLDPLTSRPVVQDLLALTRAVVQPADTAAVLAVLRAPVCGLTLDDLCRLAGDGRALDDPEALDRLDTGARRRAGHVFSALDDARTHWRRRSVRDLVEGVWQRLGGPACCSNPATDLKDAAAYLNALEQAEADGLLADWNDFQELLAGQYTEGDPPSDSVKLEILTMHGAKGLEWDLVVLPALHKSPPGGAGELLHWLPFTGEDGAEEVLFAPLRSAEQAENPALVDMIRNEQKARSAFENQRLLYVASTRARERLVLSASLDPDKEDLKPAAGSLLADLWPTTGEAFLAALADAPATAAAAAPADAPAVEQSLRRVAAGWQPDIGAPFHWRPALLPREPDTEIEFNWAGVQARRIGTVLHRLLEHVGRLGIENLAAGERQRLLQRIPRALRALGTREALLDDYAAVIRQALQTTLDSDTGRWLLSNTHRDAACELAVSGVIDGTIVNAIVDRTFIDEHGVRWIIDYKTGHHEGSDLDNFLEQEAERYRDQLAGYRRLFEQLGERNIRTALYLPRHDSIVDCA
ncbi:MAG: UvrD-helicase domain-containing protein [Gammaproteobacteria bacterium]|nr:UvrD-helicase domain-containing protein [Gammaproteobacteria bacterium]